VLRNAARGGQERFLVALGDGVERPRIASALNSVVSGIPGKKSHGDPPARDGMRTYHLFQKQPLLQGDGTIIKLAMNQLEVARFTYDRSAPTGVAKPQENDKQ